MSFRIGLSVIVREEPGIIRYIGETQFAPGIWYGIELDQEKGKNDGSVNGVEYFKCSKAGSYGVFVRQALVEIDSKRAITPVTRTSVFGTGSPIPSTRSPTLSRSTGSPVPNTRSPDITQSSTLHKIIEKLQSKLQVTTKDIQSYREQIEKLESEVQTQSKRANELEGQLEMVAVDKEFLSESKNGIYNQLKDLQLKYDELKTDHQIILEETELNKQIENEIKSQYRNGTDSEGPPQDIQIILSRNKQLESALMNLQNLTEKSEINLRNEIQTLKSQLKESGSHLGDYSDIKKKLKLAQETIASLQSQLDSALTSEKIIEHLNLENEKLTQKVTSLQKTVEELSELHELDRSLEENQTLVENDLRADLKNLSVVIKQDKSLIKELEKKNLYLLTKIQEFKKEGDVGSLSQDGELEGRETLLKQIESYKLEIKKLKSGGLSQSISSKITESSATLLREKFNLLVPKSFPLNGHIDVLFKIQTNIQTSTLISNALKRIDVDILELPGALKHKLLHSNSILVNFLRTILHLWEYNYAGFSDIQEKFINELNNLELNLVGILNSIKELDALSSFSTDNVFSFIFATLDLISLDKAANLEFGTIAYIRFLTTCCTTTTETTESIINAIRYLLGTVDTDVSLGGKLSNLAQSFSHIQSRAAKQANELDSFDKTTDLILTRNDISTAETLKTIQKSIDVLAEFLNDRGPDSHIIESNNGDLGSIDELQKALVKILNIGFSSKTIQPLSLYQALESESAPNDTVPTSSDDPLLIKEKYDEVSQRLLEKDRLIHDFQLNIQLLEGNMKSFGNSHIEQLNQIKKELESTKSEHDTSKKTIEGLMNKNLDLELEIQNLIKSSQILQNGDLLSNFEDLHSENQTNNKLALIEEIMLLRKIVQNNESEIVEDNLSWLQKPITKDSKDSQTAFPNCNSLAPSLRKLAGQTKPISLKSIDTWSPKASSQRFIALSLREQALNYYSERNATFKSPLR